MSVTLKLADEDAQVIHRILSIVGTQVAEEGDVVKYDAWYYAVKNACSNRDNRSLIELAGAFHVAVRANQR